MENIWHFKTNTALVKIGVLNMIKNRTDKHINKILGCLSQCELFKKNVLYGTTDLIRRVL